MITQIRTEAISGDIDDLAHVTTHEQMADCLTKASADPEYLIKAVDTGFLPNADRYEPFREMMRYKHKAYVAHWLTWSIPHASNVHTFLGCQVRDLLQQQLSLTHDSWYNTDE